jgi:ABC-2 type transport system ATP-binding protein
MVKKAQIAAALIPAPHVLLMDEPLRSLDSATTDAALGLLHDFVADDGVAVVASHLQSELSTLADAVIEMGTERKS